MKISDNIADDMQIAYEVYPPQTRLLQEP